MSTRFKKPWSHPRMGSEEVRMRQYAESIESQQHLDHILSQVAPAIAEAWMQRYRHFLKFKARDFGVSPVLEPEVEPSVSN